MIAVRIDFLWFNCITETQLLKKALTGQEQKVTKDTVLREQRKADSKLTLNTISYQLCFFIRSVFGRKYLA